MGSSYYVAPEVLHGSCSLKANIWSIGVTIYILLCGTRHFLARNESGVFRSILTVHPNLMIHPKPKNLGKRLLIRTIRKEGQQPKVSVSCTLCYFGIVIFIQPPLSGI